MNRTEQTYDDFIKAFVRSYKGYCGNNISLKKVASLRNVALNIFDEIYELMGDDTPSTANSFVEFYLNIEDNFGGEKTSEKLLAIANNMGRDSDSPYYFNKILTFHTNCLVEKLSKKLWEIEKLFEVEFSLKNVMAVKPIYDYVHEDERNSSYHLGRVRYFIENNDGTPLDISESSRILYLCDGWHRLIAALLSKKNSIVVSYTGSKSFLGDWYKDSPHNKFKCIIPNGFTAPITRFKGNYMSLTASQVVSAGIKFLDKIHDGEWRSKINLDKLNLECDENCILGQVYGVYYKPFHKYLNSDRKKACELGFDCSRSFLNVDGLDNKELCEEWKRQLSNGYSFEKWLTQKDSCGTYSNDLVFGLYQLWQSAKSF